MLEIIVGLLSACMAKDEYLAMSTEVIRELQDNLIAADCRIMQMEAIITEMDDIITTLTEECQAE